MSYVVLSLKYRPQVFEDVAGQEHVTRTLVNAFKKDRVAQGYMFTGPRGVGKTTTARILAKALNCMESPGDPCNKCSNCLEIIDGRNMDVLEIDGASNRGIEEIRNLREQIKYAPMNAPFKIFIIDEVHMLTTQAFNALLRTLEEPPAHGKFILATTDIHKVPPTILSRCQRFDFNRMTVDTIAVRIRDIMKKEQLDIDEMSVMAVSRKADGSMRDALSLLDQVIAFAGEKITYDDVTQVLGLIPIDIFFELFNGFQGKDAGAVLTFLNKVRQSGLPVSEVSRGINEHIRNMLFAFYPEAFESLDLSEDVIKRYTDSITNWDTKDLVRISKIISETENESKKASQPLILLEITMMRILEMDSAVRITSLIKGDFKPEMPKIVPPKPEIEEIKTENKPVREEKIVPEPIVPEPETVEETEEVVEDTEPAIEIVDEQEKIQETEEEKPVEIDIDKIWVKAFQTLRKDRPSIAAILEDSKLDVGTNNRFTITIYGQSDFSLHMAEKGKSYIDGLLTKELEKPCSVNFELAKDETPEKPKMQMNQESDNSGNSEETVARIIELFDGEIVS